MKLLKIIGLIISVLMLQGCPGGLGGFDLYYVGIPDIGYPTR